MDLETGKVIAAGLMAFAMMGAALGIGQIFTAFLNGIARNPATEKKMMVWAFVGAGMAELMGLVAIVIALVNLI